MYMYLHCKPTLYSSHILLPFYDDGHSIPVACSVGSRLTHVHLLSGGVLPLLSLLESTLARHAHTVPLSREARSLRVVRVRLDDGRRVIGIRYPLPLISEISSMLSLLRHSKQVSCLVVYTLYNNNYVYVILCCTTFYG